MLQDEWDNNEYVIRADYNLPEQATFIARDGSTFTTQEIVDEWLEADGDEKMSEARKLVMFLSQELVARELAGWAMARIVRGELRAVVDSPDEWE